MDNRSDQKLNPSPDLNWQEIRDLLVAVDASNVFELTLEAESFRLTLRKGSVPAAVATVEARDPVATAPLPVTPPPESPPPASRSTHWIEVVSPMVGTFYSAAAPGEKAFVQLGDPVQKGQPLCIIEAMKLMNEIEAEQSGKVVEILVDNSQPVEFGQVLMRIDPQG